MIYPNKNNRKKLSILVGAFMVNVIGSVIEGTAVHLWPWVFRKGYNY